MLVPKRVKYRKQQRGRMKGKATRGNKVTYGHYGLMAMEPCWMTTNQIESGRIAINRYLRRGGTVWIKVFPDKPVTAKPAEVRMGSGKGAPEYWVAVVKPGRVLYEVAGIPEETAREALRLASYKLPIKTKFVYTDRELTQEEFDEEYARYSQVQADVIQSLEEFAEEFEEASDEELAAEAEAMAAATEAEEEEEADNEGN